MWRVWRPRFAWRSLCPVRCCLLSGLLLVMSRAEIPDTPIEPDQVEDTYGSEYLRITCEGKPGDFGWLAGRIVIVDYGLASELAQATQRAEYEAVLDTPSG
jgi:hypothetical protein